jgi:hypothetical protein
MKRLTYILALVLMNLFVLSSCERENFSYGPGENTEVTAEGTMSFAKLKLSVAAVSLAGSNTRAGEDFSDYIILIEGKGSNTYRKQWRFGDMPEVIEMTVGTYTLTATSHTPADAEFDRPYYKGTQDFAIEANKITYIDEVKCTLQSIMVTVTYDDDLAALLGDDVVATVKVTNGGSLDFAKGETRAGYYQPTVEGAYNVIETTLKGTIDGAAVEYKESFNGVKGGEHRIVKYSLSKVNNNGNGEGGTATFGITVDASCETEEINVDITTSTGREDAVADFDENRDEDDNNNSGDNSGDNNNNGSDNSGNGGGSDNSDSDNNEETNPDLPTIKGDGFNITTDWVDVSKATAANPVPVKVFIKAPKGIKSLVVKIDSPTLDAKSLEDVGLAGEFDLADPGDLEQGLNDLGFANGKQVVNQTEVTFDVTGFTYLIPILNGGQSREHRFIITVTDNDGNVKSETLKMRS